MSTRKILVKSVVFLVTVKLCASLSCQNGWLIHGNKCYLFVHMSETWINAYSYCQALSAKLARIESAGENNFIQTTAKQIKSGSVWIDGQDIAVANEWHMSDGDTEEKMTYFNWCSGQPDSNGTTRCLSLWAANGYCWDDATCSSKASGFVCESKPSYGDGDIIGK